MNTKAMGLMMLVAKGLLTHGECRTATELGDRSKYVGLSDIGKGAECLRAAVAGKVYGSMHPSADKVLDWYRDGEFEKVMEALRKQLILQRGHWFEAGVEQAFEANDAKFFTQLEIDAGFDEVPVLAHLDFVLVGKGAVRILELKSTENIPDNLYASYETQLYGQLGFLTKHWNEKRFSIRDGTGKMTFPELVKQKFGIDMPESVQDVDLEGWVLALAMSDAKAFGPYKANDTMTRFCEKTAKSIWEKASEIRNNNLDLNNVEFCKGFHPLCNFCDHAEDCPKFTIHELGDSVYDDILTELEELKSRKAKLAKDISIAEDQVREFYVNSGVNGDWLSTGDWRFRFSETAGRKSLDTQALLAEVRELLGDNQAENLIQKHTSQGLPGQRLYISKTKNKTKAEISAKDKKMSKTIKELEALKAIEMDAGEVFSGSKSGCKIIGYDKPGSFTPEVDKNYIFHDSSRDVVVWFIAPSDPLYLFGPTGSGKTSLIRQLAAKLNYPVFEITGHSRLEFPDMVGHFSVENGNMQFQYGPLAMSMKYGGLLLLNEIDLLDPATAAGLNTILDGAPLCVPENNGELIKPHPNFRFAATANTNGASDETGLYQGTLRQNLAFLDRFTLCEVGYPKAKFEEQLLEQSYPDLPESIREKMVAFAGEVRKLFMGADENPDKLTDRLEVTFSTRTLLRWADLTLRFQPLMSQGVKPINYALDRALGYRASRESRAALHELVQRIFPK